MGMAAGQARLLSITSRMSDNELRAQIINNDKMRLATKSAQVSEAYTTALNEAQLMFTSYDKDNNSSYKELTFNALTAYNQYNNQYAISNSAGQLLVSETDAKNFQAADGDMNKFLEQYHLEQTTTYFEGLEKYQGANVSYYDSNGNLVQGSNGVIYNTGETVDAEINGEKVTKNVQVDSGITAEELKKMYEGDGYESYDNIKASPYYYDYSAALSNFTEAKTTYETKAAEIMNDLLKTTKVNGKDLFTMKKEISSVSGTADAKKYIEMIRKAIDGTSGSGTAVNPLTKYSKNDQEVTNFYADMNKILADAIDNKKDISSDNLIYAPDGNSITYGDFTIVKENGIWKATVTDNDGKTSTMDAVVSNNTLSFSNGKTGDEEVSYTGIPLPEYDATTGNYVKPSPAKNFTERTALDEEELKDIGIQVINRLIDAVPKTFDQSQDYFKYQWKTDSNGNVDYTTVNGQKVETVEYQAYKDAAEKLYETIYGVKMPSTFKENDWASLEDTLNIDLNKINDTTKKEQFKNIQNVTRLDKIMDTYGEPAYDWIDTSARPGEISNSSYNQNGSAKAQWYENLFNKMKTSGYKVLHDGLASSAEWMKFAFESGLVCLEQVDSNNNWNTTTYTNCSDITEQTNNAAITKAEAEYNAAMAKIENKDKRYDLELKNIDTEHNSLQTEYDSIKTAIDKNIERTFKIYS